MLLIGSRAVHCQFPDARQPNLDWDVLAFFREITDWVAENKKIIVYHNIRPDGRKLFLHTKVNGKKHVFEIELVRAGSSSALFIEANKNRMRLVAGGSMLLTVAQPTTLALIKRSHLHQAIKWDKNIEDYHFLKTRIGEPSALEQEAFLLRQKECDNRRDKKIKLSMTNDEFFKKSEGVLNRPFEHDDLHKVTCYYGRPIYETAKDDPDKALISQVRFEQLSHLDKIRMVREECFAIALERRLIPALESNNCKGLLDNAVDEAFQYALKRVCTTLTKGWFRDFAIDNYAEIKQNDRDFLKLFFEALADGKIKRKLDNEPDHSNNVLTPHDSGFVGVH